MSRKRIAIIHHCAEIGGAGKSLLQTVNMLSEKYDITVCCPGKSQMSAFLENNGVNVIEYDFSLGSVPYYSGGPKVISRTFFKELLHIFTSRKKRVQMLQKCKADIIMVNSATECIIAKDIKKYTNAQSICFVRETLPKGNKGLFFRYFKSVFNKYCDGVFFISDFDRMAYNLEICNAITVKNTVPDSYFEEYEDARDEYLTLLNVEREPEPGDYYILYLGGNSPLKGYHVICKAMEYLPSYVRLLCAGNNSKSRDNIMAPIAGRVDQLGVLEDVSNAYKACDLVVFPATSAHQGRPIFEAGAFGKTVVASDFEEIKEDLRDAINGATFKPGDPEDLALTVSSLIEGTYRGRTTEQLAEKNKSFSRKNHSITAVKSILEKGVENTLTTRTVKYLHILPSVKGRTACSFIDLIHKSFEPTEHFFIVTGTKKDVSIPAENYSNVIFLPRADTTEQGTFFAYIDKAERVFWHGTACDSQTQKRILKNREWLKKSYYITVGEETPSKDKIYKKWRAGIGNIATAFPPCIAPDLVVKSSEKGTEPRPTKQVSYGMFNRMKIDELCESRPSDLGVFNILVDVSPQSAGYEADVLDDLSRYKHNNIMLYLPLIRGHKAHNDRIKKKALSIFGSTKVQFLAEPLSIDDYIRFLWNIDAAYYGSSLAVGFDDICCMLYMNKKVFLQNGNPLLSYFKSNKISVYSRAELSQMNFDELSQKLPAHSASPLLSGELSPEVSINRWQRVFKTRKPL